jgi:glycosyltransferase involved in cell wall biosynthesis
MAAPAPSIAVAVSTRNRATRLAGLLRALRAQTLDPAEFEVVIVDDASEDKTAELLQREAQAGGFNLSVIRHQTPSGPATGREEAWRASTAQTVAFTDDDCEPSPGWLATGLEAIARNPDGFVQGRTEPIEAERPLMGPFSRTIEVTGLDPNFHTCNILYPRRLLEEIGGFDTDAFGVDPGGEDADLAWRAIAAGAHPTFEPGLLVHHAVNQLGPAGKLAVAARWAAPMRAYARHPELRRRVFHGWLFWKREHYWLARALVALVLPRRLWALRAWLVLPYVRSVLARGRLHGRTIELAPFFAVHDLVELVTVARGGIRAGSPML